MLIYLDTCCLNRPFDDQTQIRIFLESEAVLAIIALSAQGRLRVASSAVLAYEVQRIADVMRRQGIEEFLTFAAPFQLLTRAIEARAENLLPNGFKKMDALHLASAEALGVDAFLTTDDRLLSRATSGLIPFPFPVINPTQFTYPTT